MSADFYRLFYRYAWLLYGLGALLLFALGGGLAHYLGADANPGAYFVGQLWVLCLLFAGFLLHRYFDDALGAENLGRKVFRRVAWKPAMLYGAMLFLTAGAVATFFLVRMDAISQSLLVLMILGLVVTVLYATPPTRLSNSGYGEFVLALLMAAGIPTISFLLLNGEIHRLLLFVTFPLVLLNLVMLMAFDFPEYARNQKQERTTLLMRLGWENGILLHNLLILAAFFLLGISSLFGFPAFAVLPTFLLLPLGIFQIYYMFRISEGARPNWNALTIAGISLFGVLAYMFTIAFWTH